MPKRAAAIRHSLRDSGELLDLSLKGEDLSFFFGRVAFVFDAVSLWAVVMAQFCLPFTFLDRVRPFGTRIEPKGVTMTCPLLAQALRISKEDET